MTKKSKTDNSLFSVINNPHVIIYDKDNLIYVEGCGGYLGATADPIMYHSIEDGSIQYLPPRDYEFSCCVMDTKRKNYVDLDDTLMKRIAKYNKEVEIQKLDEEIETKKKHIEELDNILNDRNKRVNMLRKYIANIWNINVNEEDEEDWDEWDD